MRRSLHALKPVTVLKIKDDQVLRGRFLQDQQIIGTNDPTKSAG